MFDLEAVQRVLLSPIDAGADRLLIISGYATPTMASWHILKVKELFKRAINVDLIIGMTNYDGLSIDAHHGFVQLCSDRLNKDISQFQCQYVFQGAPVHSKIYIWMSDNTPFVAFTGSANYTQAGFSMGRREYIIECNAEKAYREYQAIEKDSIYCTHSEIEDHIMLSPSHPILDTESDYVKQWLGQGVQFVQLSLLAKNGEIGTRSGLNWGQRPGREKNQAYIPLPASIAKTEFFPLDKQHFTVVADDGKQLILRVEQQNNKAITTPMNNSLLGEYFRRRIGVSNGEYIRLEDLLNYGRTDVDIYKLDDEHYYMDFSV